ncbi:Protein CBG25659 [Caenorhabditis briggsae]|uniref:Protein CBG25659 n=1 Tax=Caenorhabditis briggsae TaxID=6238 RepID=B6ILK5_CAEBR|nr:Protein CBG25659 [Caenorhabditis briggsae]CAS00785.1 Protein CBG25659 [Caenorhabditis briggsae]
MIEFNEKKFYRYMENIEDRHDVVHSLKSLKRMRIPKALIGRSVERVEDLLREESYWRMARKVIRKVERDEKYADFGELAPILKDSKEMRTMWREARIERMDDAQRIKKFEQQEEVEISLPSPTNHEMTDIEEDTSKNKKKWKSNNDAERWRKYRNRCKKVQRQMRRKRRRKEHYSKA